MSRTRLSPFSVSFCLLAFCCARVVCVASVVPLVSEKIIDADFHLTESPLQADANNSTLELVHLLFRHGPRTPVNTYPNDPYVNDTFYPYGWGHLTNAAKHELFEMGKWLHQRYRQVLMPYYQPDALHAQSTASPRTLMSMATVLASMLAPRRTPMAWKKLYDWQPVPIFSDPLDTDHMLRMTANCPRYNEAFDEVLQLPAVQKELAEHQPLFEALSNITGANVTSANDVNSIYITLLAEQGYGLKLPAWTQQYFPAQMEFMAAQNYIYNAYTAEMRRIKGGPFLQRMFADMQAKAAGSIVPKKRKMFVYCGHDWTITNVLAALDVWQRQMPRFSALIAFELHKRPIEPYDYYVEIYFKNDPKQEPQRLTVPGCDFQCPLEKLLELSANVLPNGTFEEMCRAQKS